MSQTRSISILPMAGSALLLLLAGCATEKALTEQTQPLQAQISRVEHDLSASNKTMAADLREQSANITAKLAELERQSLAQQAETRALRGQIETLSARSAQSEQRLDAVGAMALQTQLDALKTSQAAEALSRAQATATIEQRLTDLSNTMREALAEAAKDVFLANGKEAYTLKLTGDKVLYPQNDPYVDPQDAVLLDDLTQRLAKLDQEYHLDIQGHTDNFSTDDNNYNLGKARAEVVKRYLHEKKGISISRMSAISYGANKPLDKNGGSNRRIFIRVLVLK